MRSALRVRPAAIAAVLALAVVAFLALRGNDGPRLPPLESRVLGELRVFTSWLDRHDARGYIGEVGWPAGRADGPRWAALGERWYDAADEADLWVTYWATGRWWGRDYPLAAYEARSPTGAVGVAEPQSTVIERYLGDPAELRGINVAGGEFGAPESEERESSFSNAAPGRPGTDYAFDPPGTFRYLGRRGLELVRLPFRWERVQPRLGEPLAAEEVERIRAAVRHARAAGLQVILDVHNYGAYYVAAPGGGRRAPIGSPDVTFAHFADLWRRLSTAFRPEPGIVAYGLMNEPAAMAEREEGRAGARTWERASQDAVAAVRAAGDRRLLLVPGYRYSFAGAFAEEHPRAWIRDPAQNIRYEAHHYFDGDHSGGYRRSYAAEAAVSP